MFQCNNNISLHIKRHCPGENGSWLVPWRMIGMERELAGAMENDWDGKLDQLLLVHWISNWRWRKLRDHMAGTRSEGIHHTYFKQEGVIFPITLNNIDIFMDIDDTRCHRVMGSNLTRIVILWWHQDLIFYLSQTHTIAHKNTIK